TLASGVDFLGWVHFPDHRVLRITTRKRMTKRVAVHPTKETIASYEGLLKYGNGYRIKNKMTVKQEMPRPSRGVGGGGGFGQKNVLCFFFSPPRGKIGGRAPRERANRDPRRAGHFL